jgi:hypothetical protein
MPPTTTTTKLSKEDQETIRKWWRDYDVPVIGVYTKDKGVHVTDWPDMGFTNYDFEAALQRGDYDNGIAIRLGKTLTGKNGGYLTAIDLDHESAVTAWFGDWDRVIRYAQSGFVEWHKDKTSLHVLVYSDEPFKTVNFKLKGGQIEIRCERQLLFAAPSLHRDGNKRCPLDSDEIPKLNHDRVLMLKAKIDALHAKYMSDEDRTAYNAWLDNSDTIFGEGRET